MPKILMEPENPIEKSSHVLSTMFLVITFLIVCIFLIFAKAPLLFTIPFILFFVIFLLLLRSRIIKIKQRRKDAYLLKITDEDIQILDRSKQTIKKYPVTNIDKIGIEYDQETADPGEGSNSGNYIKLNLIQGKDSNSYFIQCQWNEIIVIPTSESDLISVNKLIITLNNLGFYYFYEDNKKSRTMWYRKPNSGEKIPPTFKEYQKILGF